MKKSFVIVLSLMLAFLCWGCGRSKVNSSNRQSSVSSSQVSSMENIASNSENVASSSVTSSSEIVSSSSKNDVSSSVEQSVTSSKENSSMNASSSTQIIDYGSLSIASVITYKGYYAELNPVFSKTEGVEPITYEYDNTKIKIENGKAYGLQQNSYVKVNASTSHLSTTFYVTVGEDSYLNYNNVFYNKLNDHVNYTNSANVNKKDLTIFLGDSFFDRWDFYTDFYSRWQGYNALTWGISQSTSDQWNYLIQKLYPYAPTKIVMHIGTNDIFHTAIPEEQDQNKRSAYVVASLKRLFSDIHKNLPSTKIYWYSIENRLGNGYANITAQCLPTINREIKAFAEASSYVNYLDSASIINTRPSISTNSSGYFRDDVHLNAYGYDVLENLLPVGAVSKNLSYSGSIANVVHTHEDVYKTALVGGKGDFLYTTNIKINSYSANNPHIAFIFNHDDNNRFVLWDNESKGLFFYGGIFATGAYNGSNVYSYLDASTEKEFSVSILVNGGSAYLFVNGELKSVYKNNLNVLNLSIGSSGVGLTFGQNTISFSETFAFKDYLNKVSSLSFSNGFTDVAGASKTDKTDSQATALSSSPTIWGGETFNNNGDNNAYKQHVFASTSSFIYSANVKIIKTADTNPHVSFALDSTNFNNRFLIWDNNFGTYYYGGAIVGTHFNTSINSFPSNAETTFEVVVLWNGKHGYFFVNNALQRVYTNLGNVSYFATYGVGCKAEFTNIYTALGGTTKFSEYLARKDVQFFETKSCEGSQLLDVAGIADFSNATTLNSVDEAIVIPNTNSNFVLESYVTLTSYSTNAHISININGEANNRFLIWDNDSNGVFNYGGAYNGNYVSSSQDTLTFSTQTFKMSVYVTNKNAYLFINDSLKAVIVNVGTIQFISLGAQGCSALFTNNRVSKVGINEDIYQGYASLNGVASCEAITDTNKYFYDFVAGKKY